MMLEARTPPQGHLGGYHRSYNSNASQHHTPVTQRFEVAGNRDLIGIGYTPPPAAAHSFSTPPQQSGREMTTPGGGNPVTAQHYPHYCPVCMMHFSRVLVTECCQHHLCECCALDLCSAAVSSAPLSAALQRNNQKAKSRRGSTGSNTAHEAARERASHLSIVLSDPIQGYSKAETSMFKGVCLVECPFCSRHLKARWRVGGQSVARNYKDTPPHSHSQSQQQHLSFNTTGNASSLMHEGGDNSRILLLGDDEVGAGSPQPAQPRAGGPHKKVAASSSASQDNSSVNTSNGLSKSQVTLHSRSRSGTSNPPPNVPPQALTAGGSAFQDGGHPLGFIADAEHHDPQERHLNTSSASRQQRGPSADLDSSDEVSFRLDSSVSPQRAHSTPPARRPGEGEVKRSESSSQRQRDESFTSNRSVSTNAPTSSQSPNGGVQHFTISAANRRSTAQGGAHRATAMQSTRGWNSGHGMGDGTGGCYSLLQRSISSEANHSTNTSSSQERPPQPSPVKAGSSFEEMRRKLMPLGAVLQSHNNSTPGGPDAIVVPEAVRAAMRKAAEERRKRDEAPDWVQHAAAPIAEEEEEQLEDFDEGANPLAARQPKAGDAGGNNRQRRRGDRSGRQRPKEEAAREKKPSPEKKKAERAKSPGWSCNIM